MSPKWRDKNVELTAEATTFLTEKGVKVLEVDNDAYRAATRPVYDQFKASIGPDFVDSILKQVGRA